MSRLFETTSINGMTLANRFVRSATYEGLAEEDGAASPRLCDYMKQFAKGEVGLIITGHAFVSPEGQAGPRQLGIHFNHMVQGLRQMADAVHESRGRIIVQLAHAGAMGMGSDELSPIGPSRFEVPGNKERIAREMTPEEIARVTKAFGDAAARAQSAGMDGVQIHSAHGYLLSQFLSPHFNKREDRYGGPIENRARLLLEILREIRSRVGEAFPVLVKINSEDFLKNGLTREEMVQVAEMLEKNGIDAIELSGGTFASEKLTPIRKGLLKSPKDEVYYRKAAAMLKKRLSVPLILVGGILSYEVADELVREGIADHIALSRPLIREPGLVKRWHEGDLRKATCLSCNKCFRPIIRGEGVSCEVDNKAARKARKK